MKQWIRITLICSAITLGLFGSRYTSQAQPAQDSSYQAISDKFFEMLQQNKASEAFDYIFGTNPATKKMPDKVDQVKAQFTSLRNMMGPYVSHTRLAETKVADMFVYQHYFVAYERQPISIRIKYYKPGATWVCYAVQFDADLDDLIQKVADNKISVDVK
jgi:hypothetical protein